MTLMKNGERFMWLNVVVGLTATILLSTGIVLFLRAFGVGYDLGFVEQTLTGSLLIAFEIVLFSGSGRWLAQDCATFRNSDGPNGWIQ